MRKRDSSDRGKTPIRMPLGVRDYLPRAAAVRNRVVRTCIDTFERWGYQPIITPVFEYADVLARGSDVPAIRFVEPATGEVAALRPDITPQVARLVATRLAELPGPMRLCYEGSVLRLAHGLAQRELFQVGVELIDAPQPEGDAEVMALACEALARAGVENLTLDVGHMGFLHDALLGTSPRLREAIAHKDTAGAERLAKAEAASSSQRRLLGKLPRLCGEPDKVLREAERLGSPAARRAVAELRDALDVLASVFPKADVTVDLGEMRGLGYYTGVRFAGFSEGHGDALVQGGRYDDLCARYGRQARATGFAIEVEAVSATLGRPGEPGASSDDTGVLVAGSLRRALKVAAELRESGERAAVYPSRSPKETELRTYAQAWGFGRILILSGTQGSWLERKGGRWRAS